MSRRFRSRAKTVRNTGDTKGPLLNMRGRGQRHAMTAKNVHHFRAIGRAAAGCVDYFGGLAEIRGPHNRRGYDGELFHILVSEIIEAVHPASRDAQCLPGTNLDGRAVNRPGKDALNTVEDLLVGVVLVGRRRQLVPDGERTSNTDTLPLESSPVSRNRIPSGPILMVSSEGLSLVVRCCISRPF